MADSPAQLQMKLRGLQSQLALCTAKLNKRTNEKNAIATNTTGAISVATAKSTADCSARQTKCDDTVASFNQKITDEKAACATFISDNQAALPNKIAAINDAAGVDQTQADLDVLKLQQDVDETNNAIAEISNLLANPSA